MAERNRPARSPRHFETLPDLRLCLTLALIGRIPKRIYWFVQKPGIIESNGWIGDRTGPKMRMDVPSDAWLSWHRGWLAVKPRTPWIFPDKTYGTDTS